MKLNFILPALIVTFTTLIAGNLSAGYNGETPVTKVYAIDSTGNIVDSTLADYRGNYHFSKLQPGQYTFLFVKNGYDQIRMDVWHVALETDYHTQLDFNLAVSEPVTLADSGVYAIEDVSTTELEDISTMDLDDTKLISGAHRGTDALVKTSAAVASTKKGISVRGSRSDGSATYIDGRRMFGYAETTEDVKSPDMSAKRAEPVISGIVTETGGVKEKAGQMTAGYWRDLDNWKKWTETHADATIMSYSKSWNFNPFNRYSVQVMDSENNTMAGQSVELRNSAGSIVWTAVTDNNGMAELWADMNSAVTDKVESDYRVTLKAGERMFEFSVKSNKPAQILNLPVKSKVNAMAEIAFVVDATGSMSDEIRFLQAELLDVIARVKSSNKCLDLKIGSVFYRDHEDAYLTLKSDFSSNPVDVINFIDEQSAGGGGDFPEAVDAAMEAAINELSWTTNTVSKIMFLILDAPPHSDSASVKRMNNLTRAAAEKGIKIIPVTASGINQTTEFLMKYLAVATNGTYVYITDHSGIGGSHEKPTGVKENVQYLNDLMVDLINQNVRWNGCKDTIDQVDTKPGKTEIIVSGQWQAQFYPNPAINQIHIKCNLVPDYMGVYNGLGQEVVKVKQPAGQVTIDVSGLTTGIYYVKCRSGESAITCRILVMH